MDSLDGNAALASYQCPLCIVRADADLFLVCSEGMILPCRRSVHGWDIAAGTGTTSGGSSGSHSNCLRCDLLREPSPGFERFPSDGAYSSSSLNSRQKRRFGIPDLR